MSMRRSAVRWRMRRSLAALTMVQHGLARDDNVVVELGAASESNSSWAASRGGFFRGEAMPRISSSVARGGGAAGAAVRDAEGVDVAGDGAVGASVADGIWCSGCTGIPACACVKTRLDAC